MKSTKFNQCLEEWYPILLSIMIVGLSFIFSFKIETDSRKDVISGTLSFVAIILGFLATSKTIMIGFKDNSAYKILQEMGYIQVLARFLASAIYSALLTSILLLSMYFCVSQMLTYLYVFFVPLTLLSFFRVLRSQIAILKI